MKKRRLTYSHEDFLIMANKIHKNTYTYISEYQGMDKHITIKCKKCSKTKTMYAKHHIRPSVTSHGRCASCAAFNRSKQNLITRRDSFYKKCRKIHGDKYNYYNDYVRSRDKIKVFCNECKADFYIKAGSLIDGRGCYMCSESVGESMIRKHLTLMGINHQQEHSFASCLSKKGYPLRFDFYLPDFNCCIEYDGLQHFKQSFLHSIRSLKETQNNDKIKNDFCKNNNIRLLRIAYTDQSKIDTIISNLLNELQLPQIHKKKPYPINPRATATQK